MKVTTNVVAYGVIVSFAKGMLQGQIIEEGNVFVTILFVVPGLEAVLLCEATSKITLNY